MKKLIAATVLAACFAAPAMANETAENCKKYAAENGSSDAGCDCLGKLADETPGLAEKLAKIQTPEDFEAADDSTKAAVGTCFPPQEG